MRNPTDFVLETLSGQLVPVRTLDGVTLQVGEAQRELARAPWSDAVTVIRGDGGLRPTPLSLTFLAGSGALDTLSAQIEEADTRAALRQPKGLWGTNFLEGYYLPLREAIPMPSESSGPKGYRQLEYELLPASTRQYGVHAGWAYPPVDYAESPGPALIAESRDDAPIYSFTGNGVVGIPLGFKRMKTGTMFVGTRFDTAGRYTLSSVGATALPHPAALGLYCDETDYYAGVGGANLRISLDSAGGAGVLPVWAMTFQENGFARVYSFDSEGFKRHGSVPVGTIPNLLAQRGFLGSSNFTGHIMPGAPRFGTPWLTHRIWDETSIARHLEAWHEDLLAIPQFAEATPVQALAFGTLPSSLNLVVGVPVSITVTVRRVGGASGVITLTPQTTNLSLRTTVRAVTDTDPDADTFTLTVWAEPGIVVGPYGLTLAATNGALSVSFLVALRVSLSAPALAPNTVAYWPVNDPVTRSIVQVLDNKAPGGTGKDLVIGGLVKISTEWDALIGDGTNEPGYGPSVVTVDSLCDIAQDHTVTWKWRDVDKLAVNSVLFSVASQTNKFEFWQAYKSATGLRIRASTGIATQTITESQPIQAFAGSQYVTVAVDVTGNITISNPKTDERQSVARPVMTGPGRMTLFGTKLSDGTVQGLSKGIALIGAAQNALVL